MEDQSEEKVKSGHGQSKESNILDAGSRQSQNTRETRDDTGHLSSSGVLIYTPSTEDKFMGQETLITGHRTYALESKGVVCTVSWVRPGPTVTQEIEWDWFRKVDFLILEKEYSDFSRSTEISSLPF